MKKNCCLLKSTCWMVEWLGPTAVGCDRWLLSNVLWLNLYSVLGEYSSKLSEYFQIQKRLLKCVMFCATNAVGISGKYVNYSNFIVCSVFIYSVFCVFIQNNAALFSYSVVSGLFH